MLRSKVLLYILMLSCMYGAKYLAVLELEPVGLSNTEAKILTQRLTSQLIAISDYTIVERANIEKILKEQKFQNSGCTDSECAVEIGQLLNTDFIVIGSVSEFGSMYSIDARLIDVAQGKGLISAEYSTENSIDYLLSNGVESIAYQLCGIGESEPLFSKIYKQRKIIGIVSFVLWLAWGLTG